MITATVNDNTSDDFTTDRETDPGGAADKRSFCNGNGPQGAPRSDVMTNEDLNPGHWWLM